MRTAEFEMEIEVFDSRGGHSPYRGQCDRCLIAVDCEKRKVMDFTTMATEACYRRMVRKQPPRIEIPPPQPTKPCPHCLTIYSRESVRKSICGFCGAPIKGD